MFQCSGNITSKSVSIRRISKTTSSIIQRQKCCFRYIYPNDYVTPLVTEGNVSLKYPGDYQQLSKILTFQYSRVRYRIRWCYWFWKSTLADIILGLLKPSKGSVLIDDIDIHQNRDFWIRGDANRTCPTIHLFI